MSLGSPFDPHSPQIQAISTLFNSFLVLAAVIFLAVSGLVVFSLFRYRERAGASMPRQHFGSRRIEVTWTVIPLLIVLALFVVTVRIMAVVDAPLEPRQAPDLVITGHQWWWEARYPNGAAAANEIHIPASRRLLARIESSDVIHDFWVRQLARKMDAVPGRAGFLWLEADTPGTYLGACAEFCGMQHAWMRFQVIADPDAEFSAWLSKQAQTAGAPAGGIGAEGVRLFQQQKCGECHTVSGTDPRSLIGPSLAHVAGRRLLGGELVNTPENLTRWIANPQSIKPGNRMPDQRLSADDLRALTAYLTTLQ